MKAANLAGPEFLRMDGLRLLLFGGKGGVGKTTCAAAAALHLAQQHPERAYLLVSTDPAHSLADCFADSAPPDNLTLREVDPQESLARFKAQHEAHLRTIALRGTFLDQTDVGQLLDLSVPGLDEVMALLEIAAWVKAERYCTIVVDTAPAGHTLRLLALPLLMQQWLSALDTMLAKHRYMTRLYRGSYSKDAVDLYLEQTAEELKHLWTLLRAPERCRFVPVMLAEALSLHVTQVLLAELERLGLGVRDASGRAPGRAKDPRLALRTLRMDLPLAVNYIVTVEPGLYFIPSLLSDPARRARFAACVNWPLVDQHLHLGGVRIEDNVLVTAGEPVVLTHAIPRDLA